MKVFRLIRTTFIAFVPLMALVACSNSDPAVDVDSRAIYDPTIIEPDTNPKLVVSLAPSHLIVNVGDDAQFAAQANRSNEVSYQWFFNNTEIENATNDSLKLTNVMADDAGTYMVVIYDENKSATFANAVLTVEDVLPFEIVRQPADLLVTEGDNATFEIEASGNESLYYQWYANNQAIQGAMDSTLTLTSVGLIDSGTTYTVDTSDANGFTITSNVALLSVDEDTSDVTIVNIGQGTVDSSKDVGPRYVRLNFESLAATEHTITVTQDSDAEIRFEVKSQDGSDLISTSRGTNPDTWTGDLEASTAYFIGLWSTDGIANYNVTVKANLALAITRHPADLKVSIGEDAEFSVEVIGSGTLSYQWFADGTRIRGENASTLTVFAISDDDNRTQYTVEISNGTDTISSSAATLRVSDPEAFTLYSHKADEDTWILDGHASTLDFNVSEEFSSWGRVLLRIDDVLLVGGDFKGIRATPKSRVTKRPWLAALNAITGQPVTRFKVPQEVDGVVRALALSHDGSKVYVGGDFGFLALDAQSGALDYSLNIKKPGRVFDIALNNNHIYVGGDFTRVESVFQRHIARYSHDGNLDKSWMPDVRGGYSNGRESPVQAITLSPSGEVVYIGGNFTSINGVNIPKTNLGTEVSLLAVDTSEDASVRPERFTPVVVKKNVPVKVRDIAVTDDYVIIAWGGPNHLGFHAHDGARLQQYDGTGDTQALKVVGDLVYVAHHGEFYGSLNNPIPSRAVESIKPEIVVAHKFHSFRIDDTDFPFERAWRVEGFFGIWGISVADDSIWISGQMSLAGSDERPVNGLARFPAIDSI